MTDLSPPPELVREWASESLATQNLCDRASQWGADQELEACCEWFVRDWTDIETADNLRAARRPKPPSLKEHALARLALLEKLIADLESAGLVPFHDKDGTIRRALESIHD